MKDFDILSLVRENVKRLIPYSSARDEFKGEASVFLDANENPFPTDFNRYPDPHQHEQPPGAVCGGILVIDKRQINAIHG